jgi:hypothetical protein
MSKKRKFTAEEREKLAEEIVASWDINMMERLGPFPKPRNLSENTRQKLINYNILIEQAVFWASRQTYLEVLKSFLLKGNWRRKFLFGILLIRNLKYVESE